MEVSLILNFGWARHLLFSVAACWGKGYLYYLEKEYLGYCRTKYLYSIAKN